MLQDRCCPHPSSHRPLKASWREDEIWGWLVLSFFIAPSAHHSSHFFLPPRPLMNHPHKYLCIRRAAEPLVMLWLFLPKFFFTYLLCVFLLMMFHASWLVFGFLFKLSIPNQSDLAEPLSRSTDLKKVIVANAVILLICVHGIFCY